MDGPQPTCQEGDMLAVGVAVVLLVSAGGASALPAGPVKPSIYNLPPPGGGAFLAAALRLQGYTPVDLVSGRVSGWVYVAARLEDKPVHLMIDTGGGENGLRTDWVWNEIPHVVGRKPPPPGGHKFVFYNEATVFHPRLNVGPISVPNLPFHYLPEHLGSNTRPQDGIPSSPGLLGTPFLRYYNAMVDYAGSRLFLLDPAGLEPGLKGEWKGVNCRMSGWTGPITDDHPVRLVLDGQKGMYTGPGAKWEFAVRYDLGKSPRQMDWVMPTKSVVPVVYRQDGDTLTVAGTLFDTGREADLRPGGFEVGGRNDPYSVVTFRRVKPKP